MQYPRPYDVVIYFTARTCKFCEYTSWYVVNCSRNISTWLTFMKMWASLIKKVILPSLFRWLTIMKLCIFIHNLDSEEHPIWQSPSPTWLWSARSRKKYTCNNSSGVSVKPMVMLLLTKCLILSTKEQEKMSCTNLQFSLWFRCSSASLLLLWLESTSTLVCSSSGIIGSSG